MEVLESNLNTGSELYRERYDHHEGLADELRRRLEEVRERDRQTLERHRGRDELYVRDRIELRLDPQTPFLALSPLAAYGLYDGRGPSAGILNGIGSVAGREVMVVANDATVKGGATTRRLRRERM